MQSEESQEKRPTIARQLPRSGSVHAESQPRTTHSRCISVSGHAIDITLALGAWVVSAVPKRRCGGACLSVQSHRCTLPQETQLTRHAEVSASGGSDLPLGLVPPCRADHHRDHHDSVTGAILLVVVKARGRIAAYGNPSYSKNTPEGFPVSDRVLCALDSITPV